MALQKEFQSWKQTGGSNFAVEFLNEDDGVVALSIKGGSVTLNITHVMDGAQAIGYFVEADGDDVPEDIDQWVTAASDFLMDKPKLTFGQVLVELMKKAPSSLSGVADENDDAEMFEDEDDAVTFEENDDERDQRRKKFAKEMEDAREDERIDQKLAGASSRISKQAQQVLMREMKTLLSLKGDGSSQALQIEMLNDRLDTWRAKLHADTFPDCALKRDLLSFASQQNKEPAIIMDINFPSDYPSEPPFIRVIRPRFLMHTGHVTIGGSVCMEALTPSGWLPTFSLENVFVEIRSQMVEGEGRLDLQNSSRDYTESEAKEAFKRVAHRYGWVK